MVVQKSTTNRNPGEIVEHLDEPESHLVQIEDGGVYKRKRTLLRYIASNPEPEESSNGWEVKDTEGGKE